MSTQSQPKERQSKGGSPRVAVNLVTWNAAPYLPECLASLRSQTFSDWRLNVIDNGSTDATLALVKKLVPGAETVAHSANTGFAPAHNEAIRLTQGDYILLLNQDVILDKHFLKRAVSFLDNNPKVAALQPRLERYDFKANRALGVIDTTGLVIFKNRRIVNRGQGQPVGEIKFREGEIFGADGAAPVYRRAALEAVKLAKLDQPREFEYLDEDFFAYKEDVDLAWRLRLAGFKAVYVPQVKGFHGRGSGDAASTDPLEIIKERREIGQFSKTLSWRNQRLMQIKNEQWPNLLRHLPWLLTKELAAWLYVLVFEPATVGAMPGMIKYIPRAFRKRQLAKATWRVKARHLRHWFL